MYTVVNYY